MDEVSSSALEQPCKCPHLSHAIARWRFASVSHAKHACHLLAFPPAISACFSVQNVSASDTAASRRALGQPASGPLSCSGPKPAAAATEARLCTQHAAVAGLEQPQTAPFPPAPFPLSRLVAPAAFPGHLCGGPTVQCAVTHIPGAAQHAHDAAFNSLPHNMFLPLTCRPPFFCAALHPRDAQPATGLGL